MKKEIIQTLKIVSLGLILSASFAFANIWNPMPSNFTTSNNASNPINVGASQVKLGAFGVGPLAVFGGSTMDTQINILGANGVGTGNLYVTGKVGIGTDPTATSEKLEVNGNIKVGSVAHAGNDLAPLCADGAIFLCPSVTVHDIVNYISPGSYSTFVLGASPGLSAWKVPDDVTTATFKVWGAGAGGGGTAIGAHTVNGQLIPASDWGEGAGGGAGGFYITTIPVTPGQIFTIVVGAGGAGGANVFSATSSYGGALTGMQKAGDGVTGGISKVVRQSDNTLIAQGNGGLALNTGGTVKKSPVDGSANSDFPGIGGMGGSFSGTGGNGNQGAVGLNIFTNTAPAPNTCSNGGGGANGGDRFTTWSSLNLCNGTSSSINGVNGVTPGGGGGGGGVDADLGGVYYGGKGGNGADGKVIISW